MEDKREDKLYVCTLKTRWGDPAYEEAHTNAGPAHAQYMSALWKMGIFWAGGPLDEGKTALEIYAVDSVEEAMVAQRNAPQYLNGYLYDDEYREWHPRHWPPATLGINPDTGKKLAG